MTPKGSKFYSKSLTLLIPILEMLDEGLTAADVATKLTLSKSLLSYYISKAGSQGYIQNFVHDTIKIYKLTQAGKKFLEEYQKYSSGISICRAENIRFKADVLTKPSNLVDWKHVEMNNWSFYISEIDSIHVKLNLGKQPTIEFLLSPVDGNGALELLVNLTQECQKAAHRLEEKTGLVVGPLRLEPRGEWVVYNPVAKRYSGTYGQVTIKDLGKVNASKPRGLGEFEFQDLRDLADFMLMPRRIEKINATLKNINGNYECIKSNLECIQSTLEGSVFGKESEQTSAALAVSLLKNESYRGGLTK